MDQPHLTLAMAAGLALVVLLAVLSGMRRRARAAVAHAVLEGTERVSVLGRGLLVGGVIVGAQWLVITHAAHNLTLFWTVLATPAVVAGLALARAYTVVTAPRTRTRRGGGHR